MAKLDEMLDGSGGALAIVRYHRKVVTRARRAVEQDERDLLAAQLGDGRIGGGAGGDEDPVDAPLAQNAQVAGLALEGVVRVAEDEVVTTRMCGALDTLDDRWEYRIGDVGHEHSESERPSESEAPRERGRPVAEAGGGGDDALARFGQQAELGPPVEHARDR